MTGRDPTRDTLRGVVEEIDIAILTSQDGNLEAIVEGDGVLPLVLDLDQRPPRLSAPPRQ